MNVGIIGAGNIGGTLARRFTELGHTVVIANSRGPETLTTVAAETGSTAVAIHETVRNADVIIVTIPEKNIPFLPTDLFSQAKDGVVVIDTGNYYPARDGHIASIESGTPESAWVAASLGRPVIKAFNNIQAQHLLSCGKPIGTVGRIALPYAGDLPVAKATVAFLIEELGFDAVDAGRLDASWRQQPGQPCYGTDLDKTKILSALEAAIEERSAAWKA